jgi:hypothetical protein
MAPAGQQGTKLYGLFIFPVKNVSIFLLCHVKLITTCYRNTVKISNSMFGRKMNNKEKEGERGVNMG